MFERTGSSCRVLSYTSRIEAYEERATNALVLKLEGGPDTTLEVRLGKPTVMTVKKRLGELLESSEVAFTGPFSSESFVIHRLVTPDYFQARFSISDAGTQGAADYYYARVIKSNGHQAWSSPIWVEGK